MLWPSRPGLYAFPYQLVASGCSNGLFPNKTYLIAYGNLYAAIQSNGVMMISHSSSGATAMSHHTILSKPRSPVAISLGWVGHSQTL